jgi:molybdenum cofactor synthesis domain-containing protein
MRTAAALIIGNELLSGKIAEQNLFVLAKTLRSIGVKLCRVVMILDEMDVIVRELRELSRDHDLLFTSGGVGPTHDDLTIEAVARAFDAGITLSAEIERLLRGYYGEAITEGHLLMARVPEGARLVSSVKVPWPTVVMRNVWVLPGVPEIFQMKMEQVKSELQGDKPFVSFAVFTQLDEGEIKALLDRVVAAYPDVDIGSYPKWNEPRYKTKLTFDATSIERAQAARDAFADGLPEGTQVNIDLASA